MNKGTWVVSEPSGCCSRQLFVETEELAIQLAEHLNRGQDEQDHWSIYELATMSESNVAELIAEWHL